GKGESDISIDGNHFVFAGDNRFVFTYDLSTDRTSPVFDTAGHAIDNPQVTPYKKITIRLLPRGTGGLLGVALLDGNVRFVRQLARADGHMDVPREADGTEVMVWFNAADETPDCENGIVKVRLSDGNATCLLQLDWSLAGHVSATDHSWVLIET